MLSKNHFYYGMIKKYIIAFQHIISDIHVLRIDEAGQVRKDIKVPVSYGTKTKLYNYLTRNAIGDKIDIILPRISFIVNGLTFDPNRKTSSLNEHKYQVDGQNETFMYSGNPYNFNVDMSVWTVYIEDVLQVIEQVASFFKPDFTVTVKEIPEIGLEKKIPVELNEITLDVENEYEDTDRIVKADLNFTLKGYLYPPLNNNVGLINHIRVKFGQIQNLNVLETVKLDWDEINDTINTTIIDGDSDNEV